MFQHHPSTRLTPLESSQAADIDTDMVPLLHALWQRGWRTLACCQDHGEAVEAEREQGQGSEPTGYHGFIEYHRGLAWLKMPTADALSMLTALSNHEVFAAHIKTRWKRGSWRMTTPVIYQQDQLTIAPAGTDGSERS